MTTPKEALELKPCPFCGGSDARSCDTYDRGFLRRFVFCHGCGARSPYFNAEDEALKWWNTRTTASLQDEDAVERVARIPHAEVDKIVSDLMSANYSDKPRLAVAIGRAIVKANERALATGLVPDEAAVRADEREKCARVADEHSFGRTIDWWLGATKKDVSAETCRSIAAAIRSGGGE